MKPDIFILFGTFLLLAPCLALPATVITPPSTSSNIVSEYPFFPRGSDSSRRQQVYGAGDFSAIGMGGGLITAISFVPGNVPYGATLPNVQIHLSTTPKAPDSLSPVFAENIGLA